MTCSNDDLLSPLGCHDCFKSCQPPVGLSPLLQHVTQLPSLFLCVDYPSLRLLYIFENFVLFFIIYFLVFVPILLATLFFSSINCVECLPFVTSSIFSSSYFCFIFSPLLVVPPFFFLSTMGKDDLRSSFCSLKHRQFNVFFVTRMA